MIDIYIYSLIFITCVLVLVPLVSTTHIFIHSFIHSSNCNFLSACYVPGTFPGAENESDRQNPCVVEFTLWRGC